MNSIYSGPFVTAAKAEFSNSQNSNQQKWAAFIKGDPRRQEVLAEALKWVASAQGLTVDAYMADHRSDVGIDEMKRYFTSVIDWVVSVFPGIPDKTMRGLPWGEFYERFAKTPYQSATMVSEAERLRDDPAVSNPKGIYEYLLGGCQHPELLGVRFFDEKTRKAAYQRQTTAAKKSGASNCPLCAAGANNNQTRIYALAEMDADHVTAWSKGGATDAANCEMLCKTHNRAKGNK